MDSSVASLATGDEIKPYKIHVSSKYLDLTKKKLELTRLPHELLLPPAREWEHGTPKSEIEPLVDFWLEQYSWRTQESHLNTILPQFRTAINVPSATVPLRIHFLHIRSQQPHAIPLLLIPTFPFTNLSLLPSLYKPLAEPESSSDSQAFHIVIPSIPGLGFSDAFSTASGILETTASIFNTLMGRLGYQFYLASSTGSGRDSPANIDYHLARLVGENFRYNCLGVHLIAPPLETPGLRKHPILWTKFTIAKFFHAAIWGYHAADFAALRESAKKASTLKGAWRSEESTPVMARGVGTGTGYGVVGMVGLREPNTIAYALCDSPVGLLSLVCSALRQKGQNHGWSRTQIIDVTQLAWLPGPEAAMRFWAGAVSEVEDLKMGKRSRVAITVFGTDGEEEYTCPAWGVVKHDVVFSQRVCGKTGLVAWERVDVVAEGIKGLAREVQKLDERLKITELEAVVVVHGEETILEEQEPDNGYGMQLDVESPDTVVPDKTNMVSEQTK